MSPSPAQATAADWLAQSELIFSAATVDAAVAQMAAQIRQALAGKPCLWLCVMRGGMYLTGQLMAYLPVAAQLDYVQANRYHGTSGQDIVWHKTPEMDLTGQTVLLLDDILDAGITLAEVKKYCLAHGAAEVLIAVLTEKDNGMDKPVKADFVGLTVPDRYVFGCGMDVYGWWRNLPEIRALKQGA